jgi:hypothetical protein
MDFHDGVWGLCAYERMQCTYVFHSVLFVGPQDPHLIQNSARSDDFLIVF